MKVSLTEAQIEALYAASGNIDPCMFDEMEDRKEGGRLFDAWVSGRKRLGDALETLNARKIVARHSKRGEV